MGASTYHYHTDQTIRTLRETAKGNTPYTIMEPEKLRTFAGRLGLENGGTDSEVALHLCEFVEKEFNRPAYEPSRIVELLAPPERKKRWKELDIFPGGIYGEMMLSTSSS
jgi:carbon-monoxide dehydrogenase catalytic subunit